MNDGEILYHGSVWKVTTVSNKGYRVMIDLDTAEIPVLRVDDHVAVALMRIPTEGAGTF